MVHSGPSSAKRPTIYRPLKGWCPFGCLEVVQHDIVSSCCRHKVPELLGTGTVAACCWIVSRDTYAQHNLIQTWYRLIAAYWRIDNSTVPKVISALAPVGPSSSSLSCIPRARETLCKRTNAKRCNSVGCEALGPTPLQAARCKPAKPRLFLPSSRFD